MKLKFELLFNTLEDMSYGDPYSATVYINKETGEEIFVFDDDPDEDIPEGLFEDDSYFVLPDPSEFTHGRSLALNFAHTHAKDRIEEIFEIFEKKGAFSRFKSLLENINKINDWYTFEEETKRRELREWCEINEIELEDENK